MRADPTARLAALSLVAAVVAFGTPAANAERICVQAVRGGTTVARSNFAVPGDASGEVRPAQVDEPTGIERQRQADLTLYRDLLASGHSLLVAPPEPGRDSAGWAMQFLFGLPPARLGAELLVREIVEPYYRPLGWRERPQAGDLIVYRRGGLPAQIAVAGSDCADCEVSQEDRGSTFFHRYPGPLYAWVHPGAGFAHARRGPRTVYRLDERRVDRLELALVDAAASCPSEPWRGDRSAGLRGSTTIPRPAIDLALVFDTSGSMQPAIDSLRRETARVAHELRALAPETRLALVAFRDFADNPATALSTTEFSGDLAAQLGLVSTWTADAGGDTPEDQLAGITAALGLGWRSTGGPLVLAKLALVVTDAPPKEPDQAGSTVRTVGAAARSAGVRLFPIIIGGDSAALAAAQQLATTTNGRALAARDGSEVAGLVLAAVRSALGERPTALTFPTTPPLPESEMISRLIGLASGAVACLLIGALLLAWGRRRERRQADSAR